MNSTACEMAEILSKNYLNPFRFEPFFTDIYTLCSCIDESQKDKKVEASVSTIETASVSTIETASVSTKKPLLYGL